MRARLSPQREVCGLLLGVDGEILDAVAICNDATEPSKSFVLDGRAHVMTSRAARQRGLRTLGHYHSHPSGSPFPSAADASMRGGEGEYWMIVTADEQSLWVSRQGADVAKAFDRVSLIVDDAPPCNRWVQGPIESAENLARLGR